MPVLIKNIIKTQKKIKLGKKQAFCEYCKAIHSPLPVKNSLYWNKILS